MQIHSLKDIFAMADELYSYLDGQDIEIDEEGFPIFTQDMFLNEWPELVVPFSNRNSLLVVHPEKTLICFFDKDQHLYPRLGKVLSEIPEYMRFMGVVGLDITITEDMDVSWQKAIYLLNQLFLAVLAVNGIKIVLNTRTAGLSVMELKHFPQNVMLASGFLGCDVIPAEDDFSYLCKILSMLPNKLILYGKHDSVVENQLERMGIDYRVYTDFHRLCKEVYHGR